MKAILSTTSGFRILFLGVLVALFTAGCSKHDDDCSPPANDQQENTTRACSAETDLEVIDEARPAGKSYRGAEADGEGNTGDGGISDDGDDEADGEGNKKNRGQH